MRKRPQVATLHRSLPAQILHLRRHVGPDRACRDGRDLRHGPFNAHPVRIRIRAGPLICQCLRNRPVARTGPPLLHRRPTPHREPLHVPLGPGETGLVRGFRLRAGDLGSKVRRFPAMAFRQSLGLSAREVFPPLDRHVDVGCCWSFVGSRSGPGDLGIPYASPGLGSLTHHGFWWPFHVTRTVHQALLREAPGQWCVLRQLGIGAAGPPRHQSSLRCDVAPCGPLWLAWTAVRIWVWSSELRRICFGSSCCDLA